MFRYLMDILRCPEGGELELHVFTEEYHDARKETDIIEGVLISKATKKAYPIINGIPRMLPTAFIENIHFYERHRDELKNYKVRFSQEEVRRFKKYNKQVKSRFEFQWKIWGKSDKVYGMDKEESKYHVFTRMVSRRIPDSHFAGKTFLGGGCGHGMYSQVMSPMVKEYIGIDIGSGIDAARWRTKDLPNVHLIQGDILKMPLKKECFDFVFSTGVIHHTANTRLAFKRLAERVKKGGNLYIWVYPKGGFFWEYTNRLVRFFTTRLPPKMLYYMSFLIIPILYVVPAYANNKPGQNTPKELAQSIYDWLSPARQSHHTQKELNSWFKAEGFDKIEEMDIKTGAVALKVRSTEPVTAG